LPLNKKLLDFLKNQSSKKRCISGIFFKKKCHRKAAHNFLNKIYSEKTSLIKTIQSIESSLEGTASKQFLESAFVSKRPIQPEKPLKASLVAK
jgi:hypothetical protein